MGKFMKKPNLTSSTAPSEMSHLPLGVRTRAKTLAIQTLHSSSSAADYCYLQLRSRRLQKPSLLSDPRGKDSSSRVKQSKKETSYIGSAQEGGSITVEDWVQAENRVVQQFGGDGFDCQSMERGARENTPCSFIMDVDANVTPSSSTRCLVSSTPNQRQQNIIPTNIPSQHEINEFFAFTDLQQELLFIERYNFDIKNDIPLSGRYEWVKVDQ